MNKAELVTTDSSPPVLDAAAWLFAKTFNCNGSATHNDCC